MSSSVQASVTIKTSPQLVPAVPPWFGEVVVTARYLRHLGILATNEEQVRLAGVGSAMTT
jgi:hypothetical protein